MVYSLLLLFFHYYLQDITEPTESYTDQNKALSSSALSNQQSDRDTLCNDYNEAIVNSVNNIILSDNQNVYPGYTTTCKTNTSSHQNTESKSSLLVFEFLQAHVYLT